MCSIMLGCGARRLAQSLSSRLVAALFLWIACVGAAPPSAATVTGVVTWRYNATLGNRGDTGATVYLIRLPIKKPIASITLAQACRFASIPGTEKAVVDGFGNVEFDNVALGKYLVVILSENVTRDTSAPADPTFAEAIRPLYSSDAVRNAALGPIWVWNGSSDDPGPPGETLFGLRAATVIPLTVKGDRSHFSYDFGTSFS
jgi:hypothetical protein